MKGGLVARLASCTGDLEVLIGNEGAVCQYQYERTDGEWFDSTFINLGSALGATVAYRFNC